MSDYSVVLNLTDRPDKDLPHSPASGIRGEMTEDEMVFLMEVSKGRRGVEVGCYCGRSTMSIWQEADFLIAVDHFMGTPYESHTKDFVNVYRSGWLYVNFLSSLLQYAFFRPDCCRNNFALLKMSSEDAANFLGNQQFDFIFIDAGHSYEDVKKDIALWRQKVKRGGTLLGHDFRRGDPHTEGVDRAVLEMIGEPDGVVGTIWYKYL